MSMKKGPVHRLMAIAMVLLIFASCFYGIKPVFAADNAGVIAVGQALSINQIIEQTYQNNLKQLSLIQQQKMKTAFWNIEAKMPKDPEGYLSMAYMAMATGGTDSKAQAVMAAWGAKKYPQSACLLNNLGFALGVLKDNKNAETVYKKVLEIDGKYLETIINLGNLYMDMGLDDQAKARYESALAVDKDYYKAWEGLYGYYMKKQDYKKAMEIAAKVLPGGFVQKGVKELQDVVEEKSESDKLERIEDGDSMDAMDRKLDEISKTKPLNLASVVDDIDPAMAQKIKQEMETTGVEVQVPQTPWPYEYSDLRDYYISVKGYEDSTTMSKESMKMDFVPNPMAGGGNSSKPSEQEIKDMAKDYLKSIQDSLGKFQGMDKDDLKQMFEAAKGLNGATQSDIFNKMAGEGPTPGAGPKMSDMTAQLGVGDKNGIVTTSNYNNYLAHKMNFQKYIAKTNKEFLEHLQKIEDNFGAEMLPLQERQRQMAEALGPERAKAYEVPWKQERNAVRERYMQEFNNYLTSFYRSHVMKGIDKMQDTQALYIKNMSNKKLKERESGEMKIAVNSFLSVYAAAKAPIDDYEIPVKSEEESEARKALNAQIEKVKAQAPKAGEPLPQLKNFEDEQKSLLQKIYEDVKFESTVGLVKLNYENAELTIGLNDPVSNRYMDLGVNIKEFSTSLTEGEGYEVGFKVSEGVKGSSLEGIEAKVGWSNRQPGRKTTIFFDDSFNAVDAQITSTPGSEGFSTEVGAGDLSVEGSVKIETTAEGTSQFVSGIKTAVKDIKVWEAQYKESLSP